MPGITMKISSAKLLDDETFNLLMTRIKETLHIVPYMEDASKIPIFTDILPEIAGLIYLSSENENLLEQSNKCVTEICSLVFNVKTKPYDAFLTNDTSTNETEKLITPNWAVKEFIQRMHSLVQNQDYIFGSISSSIACASLMKRIMLHIFEGKRSDLEPLKILGLFCAMSGLDIPLLITTSSCCNNMFKDNEKSSLNIVALNYLLEGCSTSSKYFNLTTAPEDYLAPCDWLEGVMSVLLDVNYAKNKNNWLSCFRLLLKMSISVIENNLTAIIKSTLLKITVDDAISKEEYCNLFIDLISLYSRLQQLPNFFVKLLLALTDTMKENSLGQCVSRGQVYPEILKAVTVHFHELPFGQIIELWKIFSETYATFINMSQVFPPGKGAVLFLAQFFSSLLLHPKLFDAFVPSVMYSEFGNLIRYTRKELKKNMHILYDENKEVLLIQQSFLMVCFAFGEVKLVYNVFSEEPMSDNFILKFPHNVYDCTLLLKFLNEEHTHVFYSMLKGDDKILSFFIFQLLIQKTRGLLHKEELTENELTHLQNSLSCIIHHAKENIIYNASWNADMCSLNVCNYGTAVWTIFLKYLPPLLNYVDTKGLLMICGCFRDIILQEQSSLNTSELNLKTVVLSALRSIYFQESKYFQEAFVSSIWKFDPAIFQKKRSCDEMEAEENFSDILVQLSIFHRKWMKYLESTPNCNQEETLNSLWSNVKNASSLLNRILQSKSVTRPKLKIEIFNVLQLIDCMPLEYLLPGNQVRCIIGLSVLLFLTPETQSRNEAPMIAEKISKLLGAILEGTRSIWFFDFVNSGAYMRELVNTLQKLVDGKMNGETFKWIKLLFQKVVEVIMRRRKTFVAVEEYFSELNNEGEISEISSSALLIMLEKITLLLKRKHLNLDYKESCEHLAYLLCSCCVKYFKKTKNKHCDFTYSVLIRCYVEVINILTLPSCNFDEKKKEKCFVQLPKIMKIAQKSINDTNNDDDAYLIFFACVCKQSKDFSKFIADNFFSVLWDNMYNIFQKKCSVANTTVFQKEAVVEHRISLKKEEIDLLQSLFPLIPQQNIDSIGKTLLQQMENADLAITNAFSFQMNLIIIQQIIHFISKTPEFSLSSPILVHLLPHLWLIASNQATDSDFNISMIKIPILQFINFLLREKESCIPTQNLMHCLQICDAVKLQKTINNLPLFLKYFDAVWNVIHNLLIFQPKVALDSSHSFLHIVKILLKSLIPVGSQNLVSAQDANIQLQIIQAAKNINRLMTRMAQHENKFAKLVPSLIAEYVSCVQHVTLESNVKDHLISGINRILDLCSDNSLKSLSVNINPSCRDIYANIVKNYKQFKYHGDV